MALDANEKNLFPNGSYRRAKYKFLWIFKGQHRSSKASLSPYLGKEQISY